MAAPGTVTDPSLVETATTWLVHDARSYRAYAAWPRGATEPVPGLLVVHEAFGLNDHIEDVARRFAAQGYLAVAPDLFARTGPPDPTNMDTVMAAVTGLSDRQALDDLETAVAWMRDQPRCSGRVGAIGFCMGGRLVLLLATREDQFLDSAIDCWGGRITRRNAPVDLAHPDVPVEAVPNLHCPLLGLFGDEDQNPSPEDVAELRAVLEREGKEHRLVSYPGAGHAFFADYRPTYREGPAAQAWEEMVGWLARLREATPAA